MDIMIFVILCLIIYGLVVQHISEKKKIIDECNNASKKLLDYDPDWNLRSRDLTKEEKRPTKSEEISQTARLRSDKVFQKLLSKYANFYVEYIDFSDKMPEQLKLYNILDLSTDEEVRQKILELLLNSNEEFRRKQKKEKSLEVVG